ncbi:MAG: SdpI family protein [Candidatus Kapaibacterium sp.]
MVKKNDIPHLILILIPFIIIAIFWNDFPDRIAIHFNYQNEPDSFADKETGLFLIPAMNLVFFFLFKLIPRIDPKRNFNLFGKSYHILRLAIHAFLLFMFIILAMYALGYDLNIGFIVVYAVTLIFLVAGNFLGKIRANYFLGIRTPWTLENEENWNKTHRVAGGVWVGGSIIMIVLLPFINLELLPWVFFSYFLLIVIIPVIYSYIIYNRKADRA